MSPSVRRAVFLDKDGTLIENEPYNVSPERVRFAADAFPLLRDLQSADYDFYIVTNQPGIALGLFPMNDLLEHLEYISGQLKLNGIRVNDIFFCPHHSDAMHASFRTPCLCRKPNPGMLIKAAHSHKLDMSQSWMIGDILDDIEAGHKAGCKTILIDNGNETIWNLTKERTPEVVCKSLPEAATFILRNEV